MSNFPSQGPPPNYGQPGYSGMPGAPRQRPTSVTVLAIIGMVIGGLGLICTPVSLLPFCTPMGDGVPAIAEIKDNKLLYGWTIGASVVGTINAIILLVGSVGAMLLREWGRKLMLTYAGIGLVMGITGAAITLPQMVQKMSEGSTPFAIGGAVGGTCGTGISLLLPVLILVFLLNPQVKQAFVPAGIPRQY